MNEKKEDQLNYWRNHITQAALNDQSLHEYSSLNKISKSALYRWNTYFSDLDKRPPAIKNAQTDTQSINEKEQPPALPAFLECSVLSETVQINNKKLPDSAWLAEVIVKVIQGLS